MHTTEIGSIKVKNVLLILFDKKNKKNHKIKVENALNKRSAWKNHGILSKRTI